ncbi:hypothetical protein MAR_024183 [Mya arenaria]|uniref:Ras-associating domain-containing protein n=1 Tax=Mya arenaria TaxID=6604 RepID=A0ABY7DT08_MYAAR|nr:hypothetical protein MAR_024183 [Mya arenaria]
MKLSSAASSTHAAGSPSLNIALRCVIMPLLTSHPSYTLRSKSHALLQSLNPLSEPDVNSSSWRTHWLSSLVSEELLSSDRKAASMSQLPTHVASQSSSSQSLSIPSPRVLCASSLKSIPSPHVLTGRAMVMSSTSAAWNISVSRMNRFIMSSLPLTPLVGTRVTLMFLVYVFWTSRSKLSWIVVCSFVLAGSSCLKMADFSRRSFLLARDIDGNFERVASGVRAPGPNQLQDPCIRRHHPLNTTARLEQGVLGLFHTGGHVDNVTTRGGLGNGDRYNGSTNLNIDICELHLEEKETMQLTDVEVEIGGAVETVSVTKATTCRDVINMVNGAGQDQYAVFEASRGVERVLSSDTKVLKLVRSWGAHAGSYTLTIRPRDKIISKVASISHAKKKLQRLRSAIWKHELPSNKKLQTTFHDNLDRDVQKTYTKNISVTRVPPRGVSGKLDIMKRFIRDTEIFPAADVEDMTIDLPVRTCGDGMDNGSGDELWDATCVVRCDMDAAFLSEECSSSDTSELNQCVLPNDKLMSDSESAFSDCSSVCDLERNVYDGGDVSSGFLTRLRAMFSHGALAACADDAALESFMNTLIETGSQSDEGLGSLGSDVLV